MHKENSNSMTSEERLFLLELARKSIESELSGVHLTIPDVVSPSLLQHRGAFVTLHKHGQLRGCIGTFVADKPLYKVVQEMAVSAAFRDPRFPPLSETELPKIDLEISVLTPLRPVEDIEEIQVGTHGIYLMNGPCHGVLLPQVATEYGWDRETFLDHTCLKAGMYPGCWKEPATRIYIFSAEIFSEQTQSPES